MKLGKKNLIYSLILAVVLLVFLIGYFSYMLPSLYVDYVNDQNLRSIRAQHEAFIRDGSYANIQVKNPSACMSVRIPLQGDSITVTGLFFTTTITASSKELKDLLAQFQNMLKTAVQEDSFYDSSETKEELNSLRNRLEDILSTFTTDVSGLPFSLEIETAMDSEDPYHGEFFKYHHISDSLSIIEAGVYDSNSRYISYIALGTTSDAFVISILPAVTPEIEELRPIVMESLPMISAVILLLVLLFSQIYSKGIVTPLEQLVSHTTVMKQSKDLTARALFPGRDRQDEIGQLARTLEDLYTRLKEQYGELAEKNESLENENKRREIFLRSSSHQLKTPIAAALLLVEGMMNQVGKYKDTSLYLPKVKEQLLSMRRMVEDILYLSRQEGCLTLQPVDLPSLLEKRLSALQIPLSEKNLKLQITVDRTSSLLSDEAFLSQILDNLLSNAITYTPKDERIRITLSENRLCIENYGITIPEDILPHIFDPFVSGSQSGSGHGLGLYIASYYADKLNIRLEILNQENHVVANMYFSPEQSI